MTYSSRAGGMPVAFVMMPGVSREALAFHVTNIRMLMAKLSTVTRWFQINLQTASKVRPPGLPLIISIIKAKNVSPRFK